MSGESGKNSGALSRIGQGHIALLGAVLTLVLLMFMLWEISILYQENLIHSKQAEVDAQLYSSGNSLEYQVNKYFAHLDGLSAFASANPAKEELDDTFEVFSSGLYSGSPAFRSIELYSNSSEVYVYPVEGNEAVVGRTLDDLINDERSQVRADVQRAIQTQQVVITGPYEMQRGGLGIVARQAVYVNDSSWGMVSMVLDVPPLLQEAGVVSETENIDMALRDNSGQLLFGSNEIFLMEPMIHDVKLPEGNWELAAVPKGGWENSVADTLQIFVKGGIVIVLLLTLLVYLLLSYSVSLKTQVSERTASLKESERRYRQLFDNNSDSLFLIDENSKILDANKVAEDLYGYPRDQLLSMTASELSSSSLRESSVSPMKDIMDHGMQFQWTHARRDGTEFPVDINANPITLDDQKYILASVRDITENKKTENALLESESRYRLLTDTARDFIIVHNLEGKVLYANRIAVEFSGYTEEELLSRNVTQFVAPEEMEIMKKRREQRLENEREKYLYETVFVDKDGNEIPVEVSSVPMEEEGLRPSILIIARDITERKKTESALIKSEEMFSTVFNTVPDGIMLSSFDGTIINVNESFIKNKGFEMEKLIGFSINDINIWPDVAVCEQYLKQLKIHGLVRNFGTEIITKTGESRQVMISGDIITTNGDKYILTVFRDITELKHAENELKKSKSLLDEVSEIANIGGWSFDVESGNVTWTPEIFKIYDLDQENETHLELNSALAYYVPESRSIIEKAVMDSVEKGESYDFELEIISAKGNHKWVRASGRPVFNNGNVEKVIGSMQDITDRKNVEIVLHKQEHLLNEVGDIAKIGGWEFDVSTGEGTWTSEVARIHGVNPDDPTNKDIGVSFFVSESKEIIQVAIRNAIDNAEPYDLELELISADGVNKWVRTLGRPILKDGKVVKLTGAMQDITERKLAADMLRDSEERFRATFEQAAVGMCQASLDGYFIQVNQRFCDIAGYASEELVKMNFPAISYSEDLQKELPYVDKLLTGRLNDYSMEKRYIRKDGSIIWVNVTVAIVHSSEGKPLYFIGMVEDIDYRKKVEEEVVHYTERLNLLHDIDKGIISSSSAEQVANKVLKHLRNLMSCSFARLMLVNDDVSRASIFAVDSSYESQIKEGQQTKLNKNKRLEQLQAGKVLLFPDLKASVGYTSPMVSILVKEGMRSALSAPLTIEGKLIGVLNLADFKPGFFTKDHQEIVEEIANQLAIAIHHSRLNDQVRQHADELEERVAERTSQLEAANKELEAFTYSVSHDLRSPLRAIDGFSRIVTEDYDSLLDDEGKRLFNVIRTNTQKMDKLITDLLGLSRVGRNEMNFTLIGMNAMVDSVYSDLMESESKKNIEFNVSDLPDSYADPALTKQIWTNLLSNAIKYSSSQDMGVIIEVGAYTEDGMNIYYVKDNGVGFDPKYAHKLFGIFQRLHSEKEFPGTGVGLAIVQRIARRHGGDVWAEGESGKGATFYFSLPVKNGGDVYGE
jgi:PAS domain S-box-containing protein